MGLGGTRPPPLSPPSGGVEDEALEGILPLLPADQLRIVRGVRHLWTDVGVEWVELIRWSRCPTRE